jgi:hypothetical protein
LCDLIENDVHRLDRYLNEYVSEPHKLIIPCKSFGNFTAELESNSFWAKLYNLRSLIPEKEIDGMLSLITSYICKKYTDTWFLAVGRGKVLEAIINRYIVDYFELQK